MILYFSGTGNSAYTAEKIGRNIQDGSVNLFKKIRTHDYTEICSDTPWVIVSPTYAWRLPRILSDWLEKTNLTGSRDIYFVLTCGQNIGNAGAYAQKLCEKKGMNFLGCMPVVMPENYIAMFHTPAREEAEEIILRAEKDIDKISAIIKEKERYCSSPITVIDRVSSGIVNVLFYPLFVHAGKFYATEDCISCGKCEKLCPLGNITLQDGKPVWGKDCTHCMACICSCPKEAVEYGKRSKGQIRYTCPKR